MDRIFLDANVLFAAAYGSRGIERLWDLQRDGRCRLLASPYVCEEADRNCKKADRHLPKPEQHDRLQSLLKEVDLVADAPAVPCPIDVPDKDRPVVSAALQAKATHLLTGDERHFGQHYGSRVDGMEIVRPADYLRTLRTGKER